MITKNIVRTLGLESLKRTIVVKSFMHTEAIDTEFVVVELLKEDGTVALVRAYVVDSITEMTKVTVPEEIRGEFSASADWPADRYHGEIEILLGIEELALQPKRLEIRGNLGIFKSPPISHNHTRGKTQKSLPSTNGAIPGLHDAEKSSSPSRPEKLPHKTDGQPVPARRHNGGLYPKNMQQL